MTYLDHNATSPLIPEVLEAMLPWMRVPANPSSAHRDGQRAAAAVERARQQVADLVGMPPRRVVFTSGATEANHLFLHAMSRAGRTARVGIGATEHPCVHAAARRWCGEVVPIAVDARGRFTEIPTALDGVSLMAANHETGVSHPVSDATQPGRWLHVDATAAAGRRRLSLGFADGVTLSSHKLGGPMGVGALCTREAIEPLMAGGSQERGQRAGTVNTPGVVGFGHAAHLARTELESRRARWNACQQRLIQGLLELGGRIIGPPDVPSVVSVVFGDTPADLLVQTLDMHGIAASAGSACSSGSTDASPVLVAMADPNPRGGVRFSMGWNTTLGDVDCVLDTLPTLLEALSDL